MAYLEGGELVEVVTKFDGGAVVRLMYEEVDENVGLFDSEPFIVGRVFDEPPVAKLHESYVREQKRIKDLIEQRENIAKEISLQTDVRDKLKSEIADFRNLSAEDEALLRIHRFMTGQITHVAFIDSYNPCFQPISELKAEYSSYLPLLTLVGNHSSKERKWVVSRTTTAREYETEVVLCCSIEEAREAIKAPFARKLYDSQGSIDTLQRLLVSAETMGLDVDEKYRTKLEVLKSDAARKHREDLEKQLAAIK